MSDFDLSDFSKKELDEITKKAAVFADAQMRLQQAFAQWYTDKTGTPMVGAILKVDGESYKVLHHDDKALGYFLVCVTGRGLTGQGFLPAQVYFHGPTAEGGGAGNPISWLHEHLQEFVKDVPEALEWMKILDKAPRRM